MVLKPHDHPDIGDMVIARPARVKNALVEIAEFDRQPLADYDADPGKLRTCSHPARQPQSVALKA